MSKVVIKEDGVLIKPLGLPGWFATGFVITTVLLILKVTLLQEPGVVSETSAQNKGRDILAGFFYLLVILFTSVAILWTWLLHGLVREEVVIKDGQFIWCWRWIFLKHTVRVPLESISDLAWYGSYCSENHVSYVHFRINGGRRIKRSRGHSYDDVKKVASHLESLLPHENKLSDKTLKFYREREEEDEEGRKYRESLSKKERAYHDRIDEEDEQPGLFGLTPITYARVGLIAGFVFFSATRYLDADQIVFYAFLATVSFLLAVLLVRSLITLCFVLKRNRPYHKRSASKTDANIAYAIFFFLAGTAGGYFLYLIVGLLFAR
jgi:hypothetical protein